ncbi:MAG TPA: sulfotransferase [Acidimicrobiales bacterium]|nr:sulfotransferase [Acidimicrobiales bacterium]
MGPDPRRAHPRADDSGGVIPPRCVLSRRSLRRRVAEFSFGLAAQPPLVSRRWPPRPPDFVGIGAQRSGTSWWHSLVESHPDVHALGWPFKELHFFDRFADEPFTDADAQAYRARFKAPPGRIVGEWTPRYMYDAHTPALLHRVAPDARLLVLLRDPVARFRSGRAHGAARGDVGEAARRDALQRGLYGEQLARVLAHYRREQLLVLQFERCVASPGAELARTFAFLGLAPFTPRQLTQPVNRSAGAPPPLAAAERAELVAFYTEDVAHLAAEFPEIDMGLWPEFAP